MTQKLIIFKRQFEIIVSSRIPLKIMSNNLSELTISQKLKNMFWRIEATCEFAWKP